MSERDFNLYLIDILDSGNAITEYVNSMPYDEFCKHRKTYSAVIREFDRHTKKSSTGKKVITSLTRSQ